MPVSPYARTLVAAATLTLLGGCAGSPPARDDPADAAQRPAAAGSDTRSCQGSAACRASPEPRAAVQRDAVQRDSAHPGSGRRDRRRFWVKDRRRYRSPWYAGAHRRMIGYGCTAAPYYSPDPRCAGGDGFHHGLDIAMPCGTRLFSAWRATVVGPQSAGALGSAYGRNAFRLRNRRFGVDVVIGHTRRVYVHPGQSVRPGQLVARASDMGAPDGCHLHFEVRPPAGSVEQAMPPRPRLRLRAAR
jgi:murein DD-endopeptidase MepM/ murein hydrolase activator NlpD